MPTTLLQSKPQLTQTIVARSKTGELYDWLSDQGYLWMLDSPHDDRLEALAGSFPVTRMWYRKLKEHGEEPFAPPKEPREVDAAFVRVGEIIRESLASDDR